MSGKDVVHAFRKKTEECFHDIYGHTPVDIEALAKEHVRNIINEEDVDVEIIDVVITGSRCRGIEREDSDLDIVVEFKSEYWREDCLFNLLNENKFSIEGVPVDFNPITKEKTGTLEEYLPGAENYLTEKEKGLNEILLKKVKEFDVQFGCSPMVTGEFISLPAEYDGYLSNHEQRRLIEVLKKQLKEKVPSLDEKIRRADGRTQRRENKRESDIKITR